MFQAEELRLTSISIKLYHLIFISFTYIARNYGSSYDVPSVQCNQPYITGNGYSCYPCSPGFYFVSDCTKDFEQATCAKCRAGEYHPNCTLAQKCAPCLHVCPPKQVKVRDCDNFTSNTVCECENGRFWKSESGKPGEGVCKVHRRCGLGMGLLKKGTPFDDSECVPCVQGVTYSDTSSLDLCKECTICDVNYKKQCSLSSDAVCDNSSVAKSPHHVKTHISGGIIAVIVVCSILALALAVGIGFYFCRKFNLQPWQTIQYCLHSSCPHVEENGYSSGFKVDLSISESPSNHTDSEKKSDVETNGLDKLSKDENATLHTGSDRNDLNISGKINIQRCGPKNSSGSYLPSEQTVSVFNESNSLEGTESVNDEATAVGLQSFTRSKDNNGKTSESFDSRTSSLSVDAESVLPRSNRGVEVSSRVTSLASVDSGDAVWQVIIDLLMCMRWTDFVRFFRHLTANTNVKYAQNVDAEIDNEFLAQKQNFKECIYQLMRRFRQTTPLATWQDVRNSMLKCSFKSECYKMLVSLKSLKPIEIDESVIESCITDSDPANSTSHGEIAGEDTLTNTAGNILHVASETVIAMEMLKETHV